MAELESAQQTIQSLESVESRCQELESSEAAAASARDALEIRLLGREEQAQAAESWGQELAKRIDDLENKRLVEAQNQAEAHRQTGEAHFANAEQAKAEAQALKQLAGRIVAAVGREAKQLFEFGTHAEDPNENTGSGIDPAALQEAWNSGEAPESMAASIFQKLTKMVATLTRENAELRAANSSGLNATGKQQRRASVSVSSVSGPSAADLEASQMKVSSLQKEFIRLRQQNEELEFERRQQQSAAPSEVSAPASPVVPKPINNIPAAGGLTMEVKMKMKQLQQAKHRAENEVANLRQVMSNYRHSHQSELEKIQADFLEEQQRFISEKDDAFQKQQAAEKRVRMLEAKLKGRVENQRLLSAEKEAIEEQLGIAARQLEALLADEGKDKDLQRELGALSKQFELLHGKHRAQLARASEQAKELQHEQAQRQELEVSFAQSEKELGEKQEEVQVVRAQIKALEREFEVCREEQAARLRNLEQQHNQFSEELQERIQHLQGELKEARARDATSASHSMLVHKLQLEDELSKAQMSLAESHSARRKLEREVKQLQESTAGPGRWSNFESSAPLKSATERQNQKDESNVASAKENGGASVKESTNGASGLLQELQEIQDTLSNRELALMEQKASLGDQSWQESAISKKELSQKALPSEAPGQPSLEDMERDFGDLARSMGFKGDVASLWEEAQKQASGIAKQSPQTPQSRQQLQLAASPQRQSPVAADVQLKPLPGQPLEYSPPRRGVPTRSSASASYPASPGRGDEWLAEYQRQEQQSGTDEDSSPGGTEKQQGSPPLPIEAQEAFQKAEALCQKQRFKEAVPLFHRTLEILEESGLTTQSNKGPAAAVAAEVWAHLGVAMQSLDKVPEAIESYKQAVSLDKTLHVCFANLATLHAYLGKHTGAMEYIEKALELDSNNPTYGQLMNQFLRESEEKKLQEANSSKERSEEAAPDEKEKQAD
eukprot:TRINITY_DN10628_c2_g1_i1.p1 TRINITY_DN10628_c2_g1~~TRINITY_DN10628_c2_g1_i1.p1  ORF type:complete len:1097 (-),score=348.72 TRINITY_DN10628_c2_g1_i1:114-2987(-)